MGKVGVPIALPDPRVAMSQQIVKAADIGNLPSHRHARRIGFTHQFQRHQP
jgi:hypothetical protein